MSAPTLAHFKAKKPSEVNTNASAVGVGAVLIQQLGDDEHSIACVSKLLD